MAKKLDELLKRGKNGEAPAMSDKMSRIAAACADLQKKFGKESVNFLGNRKAEPLPRFSTGSISLDKIIGGGYPEGRMIEIFGPASSGKCLTKDTMIQTANGYKTLENIFLESGITPFCTQKEVPFSYPLVNMNGEIENTTHFVMNGKRPVFCTKTKHGAIIHSTAKHPLRVLSKNGFPIWKFTSELEEGDILIGRKGDRFFSSTDSINEMEATLLGLLIADGSFSDNRIGMTNSDEEILDFYRRNINCLMEFKDVELREYRQEGRIATELHLNSKEHVNEFYTRFGVCKATAKDKYVPYCILNGSEIIQKAFLRAFVDCECSINDNSIEISSASHELLNSIRLMLLNMGMESYLSQKTVKGYEQNEYWRLCLYSADVKKYIDEIGFFTSARKEVVSNLSFEGLRCNKIPNVNWLVDEYYASVDPCAKTIDASRGMHCSNEKNSKYTSDVIIRLLEKTMGYGSEHLANSLNELVNDKLLFDEVVSIEKQQEIETFDFAMERTHSFVAEGIVNHNTTLCYHALAECQKKYPDEWCGFVDSEQSFDPIYAEAVGVNVGELMTAQPDTGTDAFGMVQGMIEAGAKMIVIDSVAAMMPKEEAEEEDYAHNSIGAQARMMSKGLRKLTAIAGKHKCTLIFTNQIRNKIGVMYGSPEVTTGGKSLEYYASVRLRVSQCGKVEETVDGEKVIKAIETRITSAKNKTFAPFKTCEIVVEFGKGIDNDAGVLDLAFQYGIIKKGGGGIYTVNGEKFKGLPALKEYLEGNPELYEGIKAKTREAMDGDKQEPVIEEEIDANSMTDDEIASAVESDDNAEVGEV